MKKVTKLNLQNEATLLVKTFLVHNFCKMLVKNNVKIHSNNNKTFEEI